MYSTKTSTTFPYERTHSFIKNLLTILIMKLKFKYFMHIDE